MYWSITAFQWQMQFEYIVCQVSTISIKINCRSLTMASITLQEAQSKNLVAAVVPEASKARVEIDEFVGDNAMTNLYLLALEALQQEDVKKSVAKHNEDWWTFYSLSGIHGQPPENWNGIQKPNGIPGSYCTHGELVFPTWHRVYVNMFEQAVSIKVLEIAAKYTNEPEKSLYQNAAKRFRAPFWDPFLPRNRVPQSARLNENIWGVPKILMAKQVWVKRPGVNDLKQIDNPLYAFKFPNAALKAKSRVPVNWSRTRVPPQGKEYTIRAPSADGEGDMARLELGLRRQIISIGTNLWKLLSEYTNDGVHDNKLRTWSSFSTHNLIDPRTDKPILDRNNNPMYQRDTAVSLESWHDNIHGLIGTGQNYGGHMGDPSIAGFDPIFWLHHCNIDRLLAIYQALYPDKWMSAERAASKLYPFHKSSTEFWTSNDVKDWTTLGYAIPGNKALNDDGKKALENYLHEYYNWTTEGTSPPPSVSAKWPKDMSTSIALYGDQAKATAAPTVQFEALVASNLVTRTVSMQIPQKIEVEDKPKTVSIQAATANAAVAPPEIPTAKSVRTWNARVQIKKFAFNGSFNIHLFIGYIKDNQTERFITKKNEVGFSHIFATSEDSPCANCISQRAEGILYEDVIPISHSLYAYLKSNTDPETDGPLMSLRTLESFEPKHVVPFLKQNLSWRLTDTASNLLDDQQRLVDSKLEITISARDFDLPTAEHPLGVYHPAVEYREVTEDKVGGFGYMPPTA